MIVPAEPASAPPVAQTAELIVAALADAGVDTLFGYPGGGTNLDLIAAAHAAGLRFVLCRSETAAGLMACGVAEASGLPGVVIVGKGPGVASVVNAVAHAHLDRVPLIVISDGPTEQDRETTGHQVIDHGRILGPIVKWSTPLTAAAPREQTDAAIALSLEPPQGAVHLEFSASPASNTDPRPRAAMPSADAAALDAVGLKLAAARRPTLVVGLEAVHLGRPAALQRLAAAVRAPVLTTYKAKGTVPEGSPEWAGILTGGALERPVLDAADFVLAIGVDEVELLPRAWPRTDDTMALRRAQPQARSLAAVDLVVEDLDQAVAALQRSLAAVAPASTWTEADIARLREDAYRRLRSAGSEELSAAAVVEMVQAAAPPATIVTVDAGAHMFAATSFWRASSPRRFLISNGLATMGYAIPAAIGVSLRRPGDPVIALTGDGGATMHIAELETAARVGARIIVIVFNDSSLSLIRIKDQARGGSGDDLRLSRVRFDGMAHALGAHGEEVDNLSQLETAVRDALAREQSTVIDVALSGGEYPAMLAMLRG